jgi:hypothetical protein
MTKNQTSKGKNNQPRGLKTVEKLQHFQCGFCNKWWSIGDPDSRKQDWYCPWCGEKQKFILIRK